MIDYKMDRQVKQMKVNRKIDTAKTNCSREMDCHHCKLIYRKIIRNRKKRFKTSI